LDGRLILTPALHQLRTRIDKIVAANTTTGIIFDMSAVPDMDSAGVGELLTIHTEASRRGLKVGLAHVNRRVQEVLDITRLDGIFEVFPDETSALQGLAQA
jgi:anti-anti-sigma factor